MKILEWLQQNNVEIKEPKEEPKEELKEEPKEEPKDYDKMLSMLDILSKQLEKQQEINSNLLRRLSPTTPVNEDTLFDSFDKYRKKKGDK